MLGPLLGAVLQKRKQARSMDTLLTASPDMHTLNIICVNKLIPLKLGLIGLFNNFCVQIRFLKISPLEQINA
jgi:hypothetical protein